MFGLFVYYIVDEIYEYIEIEIILPYIIFIDN